MRRRTVLDRGAALAATALFSPAFLVPARAAPDAEVDVLLVLAVDVSRSVDEEEAALQRRGYAAALRHPSVRDAILGGELGGVGLCYLEWSGMDHQTLLVPWTRLDSAAGVEDFVARLEAAPLGIGTWTSIGQALVRARLLLAASPFAARRRVIDVSGDGANNAGGSVEAARDRAVAEGVVINGLPVMKTPGTAPPGTMPLDEYYRTSVAGGPGSFVLPAESWRSFAIAVRRKLVMEIADRAERGAVLA